MKKATPKPKPTLTLKWGTLKSWNSNGDKEFMKLLRKYSKLGMSLGAAQQRDTPKQKELICKMIDLCHGKIFLEWDGKEVTKAAAKKYVLKYGKS